MRFVYVLSVLFLVNSCSFHQTHNLSVIATKTDKYLQTGVMMHKGVELAAEQFNETSEFHKIKTIFLNDELSDERVKDFIRNQHDEYFMFGMIGPASGSAAGVVKEAADNLEVPVIVPLINSTAVKGSDDFVFTMNTSLSVSVARLTSAIKKDIKPDDNFIIIYHGMNIVYFREFAGLVESDLLASGYKNISVIEMSSDFMASYSSVVSSVETITPGGVLILDNDIHTALLAQGIKKSIPDVFLYAGEFALTRNLIANAGVYGEGMKIATSVNFNPADKKVAAFIYAFTRRFGLEPDASAFMSYHAAEVMISSLERSSYNYKKLKSQILKTVQDDDVLFNSYGDAESEPVLLMIKNGKAVVVNE